MTRSQFNALLEGLKKLRESVDDKTASEATGVYPSMHFDGAQISSGTRIAFDGSLYFARNDLWDTEQNAPDKAPNLWEKIMYKDGIRIIPEQITAENPFHLNELGWWNDVLYKSILIGVNVYNPSQYPAGWEIVEG